MSQDTFRITSPTVVLFLEDGGHVSRMISKGELLTINSETFKEEYMRCTAYKSVFSRAPRRTM